MNTAQFPRFLLFLALLCLPSLVTAQEEEGSHRAAVRTNLLSVVNLDVSAEVSYQLASGLGFYLGGGVKSAVADLTRMAWFEQSQYKQSGWGAYGGCSIPFKVRGAQGFALKPAVNFSSRHIPDFPDSINLGQPTAVSYTARTLGGYVAVGYTWAIAGPLFLEPVIGIGPAFTAPNTDVGRFSFGYLQVPAQINLGIRI